VVLKGIPDVETVAHLQKERASSMVILGSYKRSKLSMWIRSSMADVLSKNFDMPLFIAHQTR
jgi:nucleotide-binding universal stress UspA family protein